MFIKPFINNKRALGFTLLETMVALCISGLVMAVIASTTFYSTRSMLGLVNYSELNGKSMNALDIITRDIRQMKRVTSISANFVAFEQITETATNQLAFRWNGGTRQLVRDYNGVIDVLLNDCSTLKFQGFKRNPKAGAYDLYPESSNAELIKLIQVDWVCHRDILKGDRRNSESVQTAKIVIREQ